jgi:hypothetical protein
MMPNDRNSYSGISGLADGKVAETEARARGARGIVTGRWPTGRTVVRVLGLAIGVLLVVAWVLTAINS